MTLSQKVISLLNEDYHDILTKHGWNDVAYNKYKHPKFPGHSFQVYDDHIQYNYPKVGNDPGQEVIMHRSFNQRFKMIHKSLKGE